MRASELRRAKLLGGRVLDVATGDLRRRDLGIEAGVIVEPNQLNDARAVDVSDLIIMFGLWDCHAHPGSLMHDPSAEGYFEGVAARTVRAGNNMLNAASMGVTGIRCMHEASGIDLAWAAAFERGDPAGPRVIPAGRAIRTTGGHMTAWPRRHLEVEDAIEADGPAEVVKAVRSQAERGARWLKVMLTGGLFSRNEEADEPQLSDDELQALMVAARQRGLPVAAHCGGARPAERFSALGGRSIEHGYMLDERAVAAMASSGLWLVPTIGVTQNVEMMKADGWPPFAIRRASEVSPLHQASLAMGLAAGVSIATGADLNPIGPRLHDELRQLEQVGMDRLGVLHAASVGGRQMVGLDSYTCPEPGAAADLILLEADPRQDLHALRRPVGVLAYGRFLVHPDSATA
jgi:imidazolonepropionase-like amidohydrolase